jgi:signal transduction histidine kinase
MEEQIFDISEISREIASQKLLPRGKRNYLRLYIKLELLSIKNNPTLTKIDIRENIKKKFNTGWFEPKLRALFNFQDVDEIIYKFIFLKEFTKRLVKEIGFDNVKKIYQEYVSIVRYSNDINEMIAAMEKISFFSNESLQQANVDINKICSSLYHKSINVIGASATEKIELDVFEDIENYYGITEEFSEAIKSLPSEILAKEKMKLLTKDELENIAKKLRNVDQIKAEFTNIAAHELKTPLVPIIGYLSMIEKDPKAYGLTPKVIDIIRICLRNSKRLELLVQDILDISKLEAGEMKFKMINFDMREMLGNVVNDFKINAKEKNITIEFESPNKGLMVVGDEQRLQQVVANLVSNAIKFSEKGVVKINLKTDKENILVQVSDSGPGIPKESIRKIFEKFYQVQKASTRNTKGTGLGLAICNEIVKAHGGEIKVKSSIKGSTFYFSIPNAKN